MHTASKLAHSISGRQEWANPRLHAGRSIVPRLGLAFTLVSLLLLHVNRPDVNALMEPISNYGPGPFGFLFPLALCVASVAVLALAVELGAGPCPVRSRAIAGLLLLTAVATAICGVFPTDITANHVPITLTDEIHNLGNLLGFPSLAAACFLFTGSLKRRGKLEPVDRLVIGLAKAILVVFPLLVSLYVLGLPFVGLIQRFFVLCVLFWLFLMTLQVDRERRAQEM